MNGTSTNWEPVALGSSAVQWKQAQTAMGIDVSQGEWWKQPVALGTQAVGTMGLQGAIDRVLYEYGSQRAAQFPVEYRAPQGGHSGPRLFFKFLWAGARGLVLVVRGLVLVVKRRFVARNGQQEEIHEQ